MLEEAVKIYYDDQKRKEEGGLMDEVDINNVDPDVIVFRGAAGGGVDFAGHNIFLDAIPFVNEYEKTTDDNYWVAVNKKVVGEEFESFIGTGDVCLENDRKH
jgi:hypothetical protein